MSRFASLISLQHYNITEARLTHATFNSFLDILFSSSLMREKLRVKYTEIKFFFILSLLDYKTLTR